jgi:Fe-S cluster biogenesis protein NfuA
MWSSPKLNLILGTSERFIDCLKFQSHNIYLRKMALSSSTSKPGYCTSAFFIIFCISLLYSCVNSYQIHRPSVIKAVNRAITRETHSTIPLYCADADTIVSPFDAASTSGSAAASSDEDDYELELTIENVEKVLDEMRPYLQSDGGDVRLAEIDGPVVKLELVGACGTCPSSSMTMKMGLERKLKERIPEITEVVQTLPDAPKLSEAEIETVLDGVRPFLAVAGGKINIVSIKGIGGLQPVVTLKMEGSAAALQSVKIEIMQRIQRHFMQGLRIEWA